MALTTYAELQASVAGWLHRTNIAAGAPDFITLAEAGFNRDLRVRQMRAVHTVAPDGQYVDLPADYLEAIRVLYDGRRLDFVPEGLPVDTAELCMDRSYSMLGGQLWLMFPVPAADGPELDLHYYRRIPALSDDAPSNWLLEQAPDVYLWGALAQAEAFIKNDQRVALWKALFAEALTGLQATSDRAEHSGSQLVIRSA